jgi:hypothetical protein
MEMGTIGRSREEVATIIERFLMEPVGSGIG